MPTESDSPLDQLWNEYGQVFREFDDLTLAPYERRLIDTGQLTAGERAAIDAYHAQVRAALAPHLPADAAGYLASATAPL